MIWKDQSLIKPSGGNLSLITASLLLTALTVTQPASKSNGHLNSQSINPDCQLGMAWMCPLMPACVLLQSKHTRHLSSYDNSTPQVTVKRLNAFQQPEMKDKGVMRLLWTFMTRPGSFHKSNTEHLARILSCLLLTIKKRQIQTELKLTPARNHTFVRFVLRYIL